MSKVLQHGGFPIIFHYACELSKCIRLWCSGGFYTCDLYVQYCGSYNLLLSVVLYLLLRCNPSARIQHKTKHKSRASIWPLQTETKAQYRVWSRLYNFDHLHHAKEYFDTNIHFANRVIYEKSSNAFILNTN